jgi:hypothetical protein
LTSQIGNNMPAGPNSCYDGSQGLLVSFVPIVLMAPRYKDGIVIYIFVGLMEVFILWSMLVPSYAHG